MAGKRAATLSATRLSQKPKAKSSSSSDEYASPSPSPPAKKRKTNKADTSFLLQTTPISATPCPPSGRPHTLSYHRPLLLCPSKGRRHRTALLSWFDSVAASRNMPWRKPFLHSPDDAQLAVRAYQVWISEIMLQQTRVAVVIDYWNRWMAKWPTIHDLAAASPDDVLAAWRGLGYYSRATRIHDAAKLVVSEMNGLLPSSAAGLEAVPGIGRYTAGAISSIVYGRAEPMVDGNVLRVLSRQLGIYGNIKADKAVIDTIWAAADALVKAVADDGEDNPSDRPGRWGQALMELGSTVCAPKPACESCPVTATCRVYAEAQNNSKVSDIEDSCTLCEPFDEDIEIKAQKNKKSGQMTLADFAFSKPVKKAPDTEHIADYARRFPIKVVKKAVRREETVVCAVRRPDGAYLLHKRPEKGLLAGLWEFPSHTVDEGISAEQRAKLAKEHVASLGLDAAHRGEIGNVPWLFSHLKLIMHVHIFSAIESTDGRWSDDVDAESMGTGMRKCWSLVKEAE